MAAGFDRGAGMHTGYLFLAVAIIAEVQAAAPDGWVTAAAFRDRSA